jgi:hypothetical protein
MPDADPYSLTQTYADTLGLPFSQRHLTPVRFCRGSSVCDYRGMGVAGWCFGHASSTSLNLFSDGASGTEFAKGCFPDIREV